MFKSFKSENEGDIISIIPDASGCIVLTYTGTDISCEVWGATTKLVLVKNDINVIPIRIFIEFMPGGLNAITGIDQNEITDQRLPLKEISGELYCSIVDKFIKATTIDELVEGLNDVFFKAINSFKHESLIISVLNKFSDTNGLISSKDISIQENFSERHINRKFNQYIGMGIKTYSKILKVNNAIKKIKSSQNIRLTDLSSYLGFYDQSHFIHSFKQICSITPKEYIKNMSDFYNENYKY